MAYSHVRDWRARLKRRLVAGFGGKCAICGIADDVVVYDFHHMDPSKKDFLLSVGIRSWDKTLDEIKKCALLCSNCHRKAHAGSSIVPNNYQRFDENFAPKHISPQIKKPAASELLLIAADVQNRGYKAVCAAAPFSEASLRKWLESANIAPRFRAVRSDRKRPSFAT